MTLKLDIHTLNSIIGSNQMIYDFLVEKKGYFLDPITCNSMSVSYLNRLLKGEIWAPEVEKSKNWKKQVTITRLELFYKVQKLLIDQNEKSLGIDVHNLPSI